MHAFQYHKPASSKDAVSLAGQKSEGRYLAGGQSLVQAMKLRLSSPSDLIDLGNVRELAGIKVSGTSVEIGAMRPMTPCLSRIRKMLGRSRAA